MPRLIAIIQGPGPDLAALPRAVTSSVGFLAGRLGGLVRARFEGALREHSLRPRDYLLMLVLSEEAPLSQQALGARAGMDRTTTMQAAQSLEEAGLVARDDDPQDRRVYRLSLTSKGRDLASVLQEKVRAAEQEALGALSADGRKQLLGLLRTALGVPTPSPAPSRRRR